MKRPYVIGASVVTVVMGAVGFLPLFGGPGYEHAIATGLVVPSAVAIATAMDASIDRDADGPRWLVIPRTPLGSVGRGVLAGFGAAAIALITALIHAARVGICELWGALLYFALTAAIGCLLGGAWGAIAGEITGLLLRKKSIKRRRLVATLLALAAPIGCIAVSVYRFYTSPMIFAFDPFVGYFSGTLYDTLIEPGQALLTYRLGSFASLVALALLASCMFRTVGGGLGVEPKNARAVLGVMAAAVSIGITIAGGKLGHWSTTASIMKELGAEKHGPRCDVVYPNTTRELEANLLLKDCEEELAAVEKSLGVSGPRRVRAFFFRDENDKKRLMGAAHVYIAKPWREEVYLQLAGYPHPVLEHELGHVVAGRFGRGPFKIAGSLGGLLPNPGLIEGVAVFGSPENEDLADMQWALAMKRIGILPRMRHVFSLGFLSDSSSKSYMLAGAFISWVAQKYGVETVRRWYGGDDITDLAHASWDDLERQFGAHLDTISLPAEAESFARARFARPGIFSRKCPHVVDALRHEADICRDSQRYAEAIRLYSEAVRKDSIDFASKHWRAQTERRHGDHDKGRAELEKFASSDDVPRNWRDKASEALADADFVEGRFEDAAKRYDALAAKSLDEDAARTLEVKALAARDPDARPSIVGLLLGDEQRGPDIYVAGVALGTWDAQKHSSLAEYLIGRNLVQRAFYEEGTRVLRESSNGKPPTARIAREALRQRAIAACAKNDVAALLEIKSRIEAPDDPFREATGRRDSTLRMIARCAR